MSLEENCIFCRIAKGEIPCAKIYEDEKVLAFLDLAPFNYGHALVIPKEHACSLTVIPPDTLAAMMQAAAKIAPAIQHAVDAPAFNLLLNNGSVAGQEVPHTHLHIIPRLVDDGVLLSAAKKKYEGEEMAALAAKIAARLQPAAEPCK